MGKSMKLPVGIENFEEIRTDGYYYIDKTKLIEQLLDNQGKVNLFTRPRRFGKTLNMSMLKYFLKSEQIAHCLMDYIFPGIRHCAGNIWPVIPLFSLH